MTVGKIRTGELAREAVGLLIGRGETIASAESLTGGLVAAALTSVPGASAAFRGGGIVAYATDLKAAVLGVPDDLLERHGAVHSAVAEAMAEGARAQLRTTVGIATTVAGPDPAEGKPPGTVFVAVAGPGGTMSRELALTGDRTAIRAATVESALDLLVGALREDVA